MFFFDTPYCEMIDPITMKSIGKVTLGSHDGFATKALTFMIRSISTRRKITVAWYLTRSKARGSDEDSEKEIAEILFAIIEKFERIGIRIHSVTSDMGSDNLALWRYLGIFDKAAVLTYSIQYAPTRFYTSWLMSHMF